MKQLIIAYTVLTFIFSCTSKDTGTQNRPAVISVTLVVDITDTFKLSPLFDPLFALFRHDENPDSEFQFDLGFITDKMLNTSYSTHLGNASSLEAKNATDDPQFRKRSILAFYTNTKQIMRDRVPNLETIPPMNKSRCINALCGAIAEQVANGYDKIYLIAFTNLTEHSPLFNGYQDTLTAEKLEKIISSQNLLPPDLSTVTVTIVFRPATVAEDNRFHIVSKAFQQVFTSRKARFYIQSDNQTYRQ